MTVLTMPVERLSNIERTLVPAFGRSTSPFTMTDQVQDWGGLVWQYDAQVTITKGRDGRKLSAFFAELRGPINTFVMPDPSVYPPGSVGTPLVDGGSQTGKTLDTKGWTADADVLFHGDIFSLGTGADTRLYQLTADATADGSGNATLAFEPPLRSSPADEDPLEITAPKVHLRLAAPVPTRIGRADSFTFAFSAREAL